MSERVFKVGVFTHTEGRRKPLITAYTLWYNPAWHGCCVHEVLAPSGANAKRIAIKQHRERCMENP